MSDLAGKRALVTGGTGGIGRAIVERFVTSGAEVTYTGASPNSGALEIGEFRYVDLLDRSDVSDFIGVTCNERFDILVNCAGINRISPFSVISDDDFDQVLEINLRAPMALSRALVPQMVERGWGRIINVGSIFGVISRESRATYSASKFGLDGLSSGLAAEVARHGVLVNTIAPGFVDTELTRSVLGPDGIRDVEMTIPVGRLAHPSKIAELAMWLASERNTYVSGQTVVIDGGYVRI